MTAAVRLSNDAIEVEMLPAVGARLHRLRVFGHRLTLPTGCDAY